MMSERERVPGPAGADGDVCREVPRPDREATAGAGWSALGTTVHLLVTDPDTLEAARRSVAAVLETVDATYSRFRDDSELRRLERRGTRPAVVSPLLARAVGDAIAAARDTDGAVDPTVGRSVRALGYDVDLADVLARGDRPLVRLETVPGWRAIRFDPGRRLLGVPPGIELDLGSTGKALAADLAAEVAHAAVPAGGVLVNLGGDIAIAGAAPAGGWRILVADDSATSPDSPGEVIAVPGGAVATSSTTVRRWTSGGVVRHHIVDPATGLPAAGPWRTATVAAASCVAANAAATAAIVLGDRAPAWLEGLGLPARLVDRDGGVLRVAGWPLPATGPARDGRRRTEVAA